MYNVRTTSKNDAIVAPMVALLKKDTTGNPVAKTNRAPITMNQQIRSIQWEKSPWEIHWP